MSTLSHFTFHRLDQDTCHEIHPRGILEGVIGWILRRRGKTIALKSRAEMPVRTEHVDIPSVLRLVREQMAWAHRERHTPTKLIMGPQTYRQLLADPALTNLSTFTSVQVPNPVPVIGGLELVVNPCIEGIPLG